MFARLKSLVGRKALCYPPGPEAMVLYAVGDIHGRTDCLRRAHDCIDRDAVSRAGRPAAEIYIGDYVDRGPDSKGVIDCLLARAAATPIIALRGNHELLMESFLRGRLPFKDWRDLGGLETVLSYGVDARSLLQRGGSVWPRDLAEKMPVSHLQFLTDLKMLHTEGRYCFVHAGLRPGLPIERQSTEDLVWIREDFLNFPGDFGFIVVHGHTPVANVDFLTNRINIDTGAYVTNRLSVLRIDAEGVSILEPIAK